MNLVTLRDMVELWGHDCDQSGDVLRVAESDMDYCLIRWTNGGFLIEVCDTPATLLRNLGDYLEGIKAPAQFVLKSPRTKKVKYG